MLGYQWTLRVSSAEGDRATVYARKHQFTVGAPASFDEAYPAITALEYALGALGAEVVNGLRALAARRRLEVDRVEAVIQAELSDPLAFAGVVGAKGSPALSKVSVRAYVSSFEDEAPLFEVWKQTLERSPLVRTLSPVVQLELTVKVAV